MDPFHLEGPAAASRSSRTSNEPLALSEHPVVVGNSDDVALHNFE